MLPFALALNSHVVVVSNCTNIKNARARRAKFLFLLLFFFFIKYAICNVLSAVIAMVTCFP